MRSLILILYICAFSLAACSTPAPVSAPLPPPSKSVKKAPAAKPVAEASLPQPLWGTVASITDASKIVVRDATNRQYNVSLAALAPPTAAAYAERAQRYLQHLLVNQTVQVHWLERKHNDLSAKVVLNGRDINLEQLAAGYARFDAAAAAPLDADERKRYEQAEASARRGYFGLWGDAK